MGRGIKKMAEEIKKGGFELRATDRAYEKLKEIVNGSKEKIDEFVNKIMNEGIDKNDYKIFLKNGKQEFNYHKCKNIYVIFVIGDKMVTLVDFLTETEFEERKGIKI